jgi:hypothetical protein
MAVCTIPPHIISITDDAITDSNHFDRLDEFRQDYIRRYLNDLVGIDHWQARYSSGERRRVWIKYYLALEALRQPLRIHLVTDFAPNQERLLNECGVKNLLASYYRMRKQPAHLIDAFLEGRIRPPKVPGKTKEPLPRGWWIRKWNSRTYRDELAIALNERFERYRLHG